MSYAKNLSNTPTEDATSVFTVCCHVCRKTIDVRGLGAFQTYALHYKLQSYDVTCPASGQTVPADVLQKKLPKGA